MPASKNFLTFTQQVDFLKNDKHIRIPNRQYAEETLQHIGYFSLIDGYKHLFRIPFAKKYKSGTTFDEIVSLYQFDAELRELFLKYLLQIERHAGNLIAYYFCELHGVSQAEYLNPSNYNNHPRNRKIVQGLIKKLYGAVNTNEYDYINYYRTQYGNIPLWVTVNVLTFGSLSKMYNVLPQSLRSKICKHFSNVNQKQFERYLSVLSKYRNVCAHSDRLFTYKTVDQISDTVLHSKLTIPKSGNQYIYGKQDLFAVVIAFRYLLPRQDFIIFKSKLIREINKVNKKLIHISEKELLEQMGISYKTISNDKRSLKAAFYTAEQEESLLSFMQSDSVYQKYYDEVIILLGTGLRISELCGLTETDLDFENRVINVDHQLLRSAETGCYIEKPKTQSDIRHQWSFNGGRCFMYSV